MNSLSLQIVKQPKLINKKQKSCLSFTASSISFRIIANITLTYLCCLFLRVTMRVPKPYGNKYVTNPRTLGEKIRNKRIKLNLLQKDLAAIIGVCEDTITYWENNRVTPQKKYKYKILSFLKI